MISSASDPAGTAIVYRPIGIIRSEHTRTDATPIRPRYARGCRGRAKLLPVFVEGLGDIEGFSHLYLIYHLHRADAPRLRVKPFLQDVERGVFATRAPGRPNPIGLSLVRLLGREGATLLLEDVDVLDGTPLLDLKPYAPRYDTVENYNPDWAIVTQDNRIVYLVRETKGTQNLSKLYLLPIASRRASVEFLSRADHLIGHEVTLHRLHYSEDGQS